MRLAFVVALGSAGLAACASSQERPPESQVTPVTSAPPVAVSARVEVVPPEPPRPPMPPAIKELTGAACKLSSPGNGASASLFLPNRTKPFASLQSGAHELALPSSGEPVISASTPGINLRAQGRFAAISLHLRRAVVFGGVAVPSALAPLSIMSVSGDGVTLRHEFHLNGFRVFSEILQEKVACQDLSLEVQSFSKNGVLPDAAASKEVEFKDGQAIPLRAREDGPVALELEAPSPVKNPGRAAAYSIETELFKTRVSVVKTSKKQSLVIIEGGQTTLFGWVPSADLRPPPKTTAAFGGLLGLLGSGAGLDEPKKKPAEQRICGAELPLLIEQESARMTLGSVPPGVCIELRQTGKDFSRIALVKSGLRTLEDAHLLAPSWVLEACHPPTPEEAARCDGDASDRPEDSLWGSLQGGDGLGIGSLGLHGNEEGLGASRKPAKKPKKPKK